MNEIDQISGEKLIELSILNWSDDPESCNLINKILLSFESQKVLIEIDIDLDELSVIMGNDLRLTSESLGYEVVVISEDSNSELKNCLNKKLIWFWKLKNTKGYDDGVQIELSDHKNSLIIQFMAESSSIRIRKLIEIE